MAHVALYRKHRPTSFDQIYGQAPIVQVLTNQIKANRISHAYLFCGPRGTGKTTIGRIFARAINCEHPINGNPCGQCDCCKTFSDLINTDIIEIDAASNNGVDNIRSVIEESKYKPTKGKYKVYIIDEVHMMSTSAFNALLKTLEEPPAHVVFMLMTTEANKVLPTITSRCLKFNFKLMSHDDIVSSMQNILYKENITWEIQALNRIADFANGGMRDALSLLEQCLGYDNTKVTYDTVKEVFGDVDEDYVEEFAKSLETHDVSKSLDILQTIYYDGKPMQNFTMMMYEYYRDKIYNDCNNAMFYKYVDVFARLCESVKHQANAYTACEIEILKLHSINDDRYEKLSEQINALQQEIELLKHNTNANVNTNIDMHINENDFIHYAIAPCKHTAICVY